MNPFCSILRQSQFEAHGAWQNSDKIQGGDKSLTRGILVRNNFSKIFLLCLLGPLFLASSNSFALLGGLMDEMPGSVDSPAVSPGATASAVVAVSGSNATSTGGAQPSWWSFFTDKFKEGAIVLREDPPPSLASCKSVPAPKSEVVVGSLKLCQDATKQLYTTCSPGKNRYIIGAMAGLSTLGNLTNSTKDTCKKTLNAMDIVSSAMTAYSTACSALLARQIMTCRNAESQLRALEKAAIATPSAEMCSTEIKSGNTWIADMKKFNQQYQLYVASAGAGIAKLLTQRKTAASCETQTAAVDCTQNPTDASCVAAQEDPYQCQRPELAQTPICQCRVNPELTICTDLGLKVQNFRGSMDATYGGAVDNAQKVSPTGDTQISLGDMPMADSFSGVGGSNNLGVQGGLSSGDSSGSGSVGGSGLSGSAGADTPRGSRGSPYNIEINSGYESGGGSSGRRNSGNSSGSASTFGMGSGFGSPREKRISGKLGEGMRKPTSLEAGVTLRGGKSNFEKIGQRFFDLRGSLQP